MNKRNLTRALIATAILVSGTAARADLSTFTSGMLNSGDWGNYSQYYVLCGEAPAGQRIVEKIFSLRGDRQCGAWAECGLIEASATRVCYQFRMQGHNENQALFGGFTNPDNGTRKSEGVLTLKTN